VADVQIAGGDCAYQRLTRTRKKKYARANTLMVGALWGLLIGRYAPDEGGGSPGIASPNLFYLTAYAPPRKKKISALKSWPRKFIIELIPRIVWLIIAPARYCTLVDNKPIPWRLRPGNRGRRYSAPALCKSTVQNRPLSENL